VPPRPARDQSAIVFVDASAGALAEIGRVEEDPLRRDDRAVNVGRARIAMLRAPGTWSPSKTFGTPRDCW
jgi:hypothetical protein